MAPGCTMGRRQTFGVLLRNLRPAIHVDFTLTRTTYPNIVADQVQMDTFFPHDSGLVQQDDRTCHTANMLQEHDNELKVLTWLSPDSPDLTPIHHLWDELDKQVWALETPPHDFQDSKDLLRTSWCQIPGHHRHRSGEVRAVLAAKGTNTVLRRWSWCYGRCDTYFAWN